MFESSPAAQDEDHFAAAAPCQPLPGLGLALAADLEPAAGALEAPSGRCRNTGRVVGSLPREVTGHQPRPAYFVVVRVEVQQPVGRLARKFRFLAGFLARMRASAARFVAPHTFSAAVRILPLGEHLQRVGLELAGVLEDLLDAVWSWWSWSSFYSCPLLSWQNGQSREVLEDMTPEALVGITPADLPGLRPRR